MKCVFFILLLALATSFGAQMDLHQYRWKNRLLIVLAPTEADPRYAEQIAWNEAAGAGFAERQLLTLRESEPAGSLHHLFGVAPGEFRVVLVGKDGHTALTRTQPISSSDLFRVIDAMPMRQAEMRKERSGQ